MKTSKRLKGIWLICALGAMLCAGHAGAQSAADRAAWPKDIYPESGNRLPIPKREDMKGEDLKIFDDIMAKQAGGLSAREKERPQVRMHSPGVSKGLEEAHHYLKYDTALGDRLTIIAELTTARELTNQYEWTQFEEHVRTPGDPRFVAPEIVDAIKYCRPVTGLGEKEQAIITFGRELFGRRKVSPETFAKVLKLFGPRTTVDLEELMGMYSATSYELVAFDQQLHVTQKPMLQPDAQPCL